MTFDLECRNVSKQFGDFQAVNDISLEIPAGSFFSILGPSGCGKTTLLRMLAGFSEPDQGEILIKGKKMAGIPPNKRPVNMVFQHLALFPMMNIGENIAYGLKRNKVPKQERDKKVADVLERIDLPGIENKSVHQLSGGQKQRVAIARCLVLEPDVLLLDEPLGALDLKLREQMKVELKKLQQAFGTTFIYITHDQSEAMVMSDQVAVMNHGRFEQVGSPQSLYYQPNTAFVAGFVGNNNRIEGVVESIVGETAIIRSDAGQQFKTTFPEATLHSGQQVHLYIRPEAIHIRRDQNVTSENHINGRVESILFDGGNSQVLVKDTESSQELTVSLPQTREFNDLTAGEMISLSWDIRQSNVFSANNKSEP
ncbi:ABC transporter ATP-binding protein [uncultured Endozoicomonas sp.]|uniref:ABC transporter ATP-binding protein n=1 Tax=uncultured Endozoicomonas sp. TaxID=432652 RepID=UPI00262FBEC3|nr:ABC transporter ATP-binding protein [uncultured Endozoicomonas sp.]